MPHSVESTWTPIAETWYIYDGMTVIQERSNTNVPTVHYTRGLDLSGSLGGAGVIGRLLTRSSGYSSSTGAWSTHDYEHADGSGNITMLISNSSTPTIRAQYEYDPFGRIQTQSGSLATANTQRFSSKEQIGTSPLSYYGYRFFHAEAQRWMNEDLIRERFDRNLYRFTYNNPINFGDSNGLWGVQFGDFNIGWGDPDLVFDSDSWMDLSNGAAATADGLIPFVDPFADLYQNGDIWSDDNEGLSDYDSSLYETSRAGGQVAQVCLAAAVGTGIWNAARLPTMSIGGAMPPAGGYTPHFFWSVTTRAGTTTLHTLGRSTTVGAEFWGGYLGGSTSITGIPILFPGAAAAAGVTSPNCLTGLCGALRRGIIGF